MYTGHDIMRNALPANAGLNMLWPRPPNICLAMAMAKNDPTTGIHRGTSGGRLYARSKPVRTALPSQTAATSFFRRASIRASVITALAIDAIVIKNADMPNINPPAIPAGTSESVTAHIIFFVDTLSFI